MLHKEIVTLPNTDLEVEVVFYYSPAVRGRQYMPNGDPGYEDEPAELEIEQIIVKTDATGLAGGTNFTILSNKIK